EVIPMILIFVPLARALGYDSIVGVAIPMVGSGAGFAGAPLNPFTVGIAQGIAEIPLFSGIGFRWIVWAATTTVAITFVMWYAHRIKREPTRSSVYQLDRDRQDEVEGGEATPLTNNHKLVLIAFLLGMATLVFGVLQYGWYITEIAGLFLAIGIVVGILGRLKATEISQGFVAGAGDLLGTALIIGLARGILVVMRDGQIIDTVLHALATGIEGVGPVLTAQLMFLTQTAINFFIPSGSGQAALTMPLMAPLADLVGVTRQTAVLAYQMGDGFTNLIIPTNPVLMGALAVAGVPWQKWAKWIVALQLSLLVMGFGVLAAAVATGWGGGG
ncbi:MAG: YfcC family protein, partial [Gemmatimonadales bacterium]